jgi:hypothetical protein
MSARNREYVIREGCLMSGEDKCHSGLPSVEEAKERFHWRALPCPLSKTPPEELLWFYVVIPLWASKGAEEIEG